MMSKPNTLITNFNTKSDTFEIPKRLRKPHVPLMKETFDGSTFESKIDTPKTDYKRKAKYKDDYESIVDAEFDPEQYKFIQDTRGNDGVDDDTIEFYLNQK